MKQTCICIYLPHAVFNPYVQNVKSLEKHQQLPNYLHVYDRNSFRDFP